MICLGHPFGQSPSNNHCSTRCRFLLKVGKLPSPNKRDNLDHGTHEDFGSQKKSRLPKVSISAFGITCFLFNLCPSKIAGSPSKSLPTTPIRSGNKNPYRLYMIIFWRVPFLKLAFPKGKDRLPTTNFQGLCQFQGRVSVFHPVCFPRI